MRTFDARKLNGIANGPGIRWQLGGEGPIDLKLMLGNAFNYGLVNEYGGIVYVHLIEGRWECHTIFQMETPPRIAVRHAQATVEYMFINTACTEIVTIVPDNNPAADKLSAMCGFQQIERKKDWWNGVGASLRSLTLDRWARTCSRAHVAGQDFHRKLDEAKKASGVAVKSHPEDTVHDHMVGASVMMMTAGNIAKAVIFYNTWASLAKYAPVQLVSNTPPVVDIQDAIVGIENGQLEVMLCR